MRAQVAKRIVSKPLTLGDKEAVEKLTVGHLPYSDFNFASLFAWNIDGDTRIAFVNDNLIIKLPHYLTGEPVFSLYGTSNVDDVLDACFDEMEALELVPEFVVSAINHPENYTIEETPDNFDYVYDLGVLVALAGKEHKKKRNILNHIRTLYGDRLEVATTSNPDAMLCGKLYAQFDKWVGWSGKNIQDTEYERLAFGRALSNAKQLGLLITTIKLDGEICGFSMNEILQNGYAICHFEKSSCNVPHMSTYVAYIAAEALYQRGCKWVNWEQDLGIPGIRQIKSTWRPAMYMKKYRIVKSVLYSK